MRKHLLPILIVALSLAGCAGKTAQEEATGQANPAVPATAASLAPQEGSPDPCLEAWTYAPGNFVLDVAEGADVYLVPEVQEFPLFCSAALAREALLEGVAHGDLPEANGGWALYRVDGVFHDIARPVGYENYVLKRQSRLVDWSY